jgi:hypothetical protein
VAYVLSAEAELMSDMQAVDETRLPVDPASGRPIRPKTTPGYYPKLDTLNQQKYWDETTRKVVLERVEQVPPIRFFSPEEARCMQAVLEHLIPQFDRDAAHQIPLLNHVDARLHQNRIDGYQFEEMPPDREAYRLGIRGIDDLARGMYQKDFADLEPLAQDMVLKTIHDGNPPAARDIWDRLPTHYFWTMMVQDAVEAYYAHPWAWDEVGFGGPAYPRGYMRLERGLPEPWEVDEQRYEWRAPENSVSDRFEQIGGTSEHDGTGGKGGSH